MEENKIAIIIPSCSDLNRGDQALTLETMNVIKKSNLANEFYMMSDAETTQSQKYGLKEFRPILKHPSRFDKTSNNLNYNIILKIRWGIIAIFDLINSKLILNKFTRKIFLIFSSKETRKSLELYNKASVCFVKGGGFLHDYSGGLVGLYTMYYHLYHIKLALSMGKEVYIMPNSYGPFKNKNNVKKLNKILDKCKFVAARESLSALSATNGLNRNINLFPDLAFFLEQSDRVNMKNYLTKNYEYNDKQKYVGITVRPYRFYGSPNPEEKYNEYKKIFVSFIKYLNQHNYIPLLIVHTRAENDHENDEKCINEIVNLLDNKDNYLVIKDDNLDCKDLKTIYSFCDYLIGTRFHSVIFSLSNEVPSIAITYGGNKGDGIMKDIGLSDYAIKISELNFKQLVQVFENLEQNRMNIIKKIQNYKKKINEDYNILIRSIKK